MKYFSEKTFKYRMHILLRFELQLVEHCNLNCKDCTHYSPLAKPQFLDLDEIERDYKRLSELFDSEVEFIKLMGGEPLLHPEIIKIMKLTRQYFQCGHIRVVTNGTLLCENKIEIWITKYPISLPLNQIEERAQKENVRLHYNGGKSRPHMYRFPIDLSGNYLPENNFYHCLLANNCITLKYGKLYTCPVAAHAHHLKKYFNLNIAISERNGVDIYKARNAEELMERLTKPIPFCRYCDYTNFEDYADDWQVSIKDRYEWISFTFSSEDMNYLKSHENIYIYGAGKWGGYCLNKLHKYGIKVEKIIVSSLADNPSSINEIKIIELENLKEINKNDVCIIAVAGPAKIEIQSKLYQKGFKYVIPMMHLK